MLEMNKCVASKLWYTSFRISEEGSDKSLGERSKDERVDFARSGSTIRNLILCETENENQWIASIFLEKVVGNATLDVERIKEEQSYVEMEHALRMCKNLTTRTQERLLAAYKSKWEDKSSEMFEEALKECVALLEENTNDDLFVVRWILNELSLICWKARDSNTVCSVHDFYSSTLKELLETALSMEKSVDEDALGRIVCIASGIYVGKLDASDVLKRCFPILLRASDSLDIQLALYIRKDKEWFEEWCNFLNGVDERFRSVDNVRDALKLVDDLFNKGGASTCAPNKKKLTKRVSDSRLHWVSDIVDICQALIVSGKHSDYVSGILSCGLLRAFWPVLLVKVSKDCLQEETCWSKRSRGDWNVACDALEWLVSKCDFDASRDSVLGELENAVRKNVKVLRYISSSVAEGIEMKDSDRAEGATRSDAVRSRISIRRIFDLRYSNSLLALKASVDMHEEECEGMEKLLRDLEEGEEALNELKAYRAILSCLKAISLCKSYETEASVIANRFADMKGYASKLYPLDLRVRVIENLFSLLFLRHEDFDQVRKNEASDSLEQLGRETRQTKQRCTGFVCNEYIARDVLFHLRELTRASARERASAETEKGIASVSAAITDATWRLEVYTSSEFVESGGPAVEKGRCPVRKSNGRTFPEGKSICDRSKERRSQVFFYQEGQISDETRGKSNNSSSEAEGLQHGNGKWRKRSKYAGSMTDENAASGHVARKPSLVNSMLAPVESLIVRCLWANDYAKAENLIEASGTRDTRLAGEVQFSRALHRFRRQVCKEGAGPRGKEELPGNSLQTSTLENIRMAVQGGIQSSRQTSQFETFLASQEATLRMLSMEEEERNGNDILAICALDLALTTCCQIYPVSQNLCEVALKYLQLCKTFESTEHARFFYKFYQLLGENILGSAKIGFSAKEWKEREDFWTGIAIKHREFRESQATRDASDEVSKDGNCLPGLKPLRKMAALCCGTKGCIQNIYSHLQLLHTIVPAERATTTESDLLKIPLHYYFGYQIFQLKIEPRKLETIARDLQVNLAYSILKNACPGLDSGPFRQKDEGEGGGCRTTRVSAESECSILNRGSRKSDPGSSSQARGANRCVAEILGELVNLLRDLSSNRPRLSREFCQGICERAELQSVLEKTSRLTRVDLTELSGGEERLAFLLNTWNLMFLHASLTVWANRPPFTTELQRAVSLMSVGYSIGDLGLVTLAALRSKLFKGAPFAPPFFAQVEEPSEPAWQDFDISPEPRAIFGMANEYFGAPRVRVYDPASLEEDLTVARREYLDHYSSSNERAPFEEFRRIAERSEDSPSCPSSYDIVLRYENCSAAAPATQHRQEARADFPWKIHGTRSSLLQYLEGQCWPVSYLLQRMYNECPTILDNNCDKLKRTACLENLLSSPWIKESKILFESNETLAAIFETVPMRGLWSHFELMLKDDKWNGCLKLINALPNRLAARNDVQYLRDKVLSRVVSKKDSPLNTEILPCFYQIKDPYVSSQTVLQNIEKWQMNVCENALLHAVHHASNRSLPVHCRLRLKETLRRVLVFRKMLPYCGTKSNGSWYDVAYCTERIDPLQIVGSLINGEKFHLCLEWLECQAFSFEMHPSATEELLIGLLKSEIQNCKQTLKFLQALPLDRSIKLCKTVLKRLETIDSLRFISDYLWRYCRATETTKYRQTLLGIDILSMLDARERPLYIHLIKEPLLMLEQLLMNCKFESIRRVLSKVQEKLDGAGVSRTSFDTVVRFYAKKSLDCRVSLLADNAEGKSRSVQSPASDTENTEFVMPALVPTKEEWVPNDKARKCSCCKNVIFSMFNRRHHCRRCGRVICATCSQHRMQVSGYPASVLVRVCDDCKRQTVLQMQGTLSTPSSEAFDYWRLTRDERHNETIREEFSFEYAPNISLCLAILNLHSEHKTYASFLLDRCDEMKLLLQPVNGGKVNPEVDHSVIINMIRSLLLAAKVKCAKLGLNAGLVHCDRFLSHVDLITSLVRSDCLHLIPSDSLQNHTLRKLRDILIEKEEWTLALDVSTKAGLDTQGVWATWGRACLKMEHFVPARDKFFHCLDKVHYEHFDDWVLLPRLGESEGSSKKQGQESTRRIDGDGDGDEEIKADDSSSRRGELSKSRPLNDPPLLTEILQMLDNLRICNSAAGQETFTGFGNLRFPTQKQLDAKRVSALLRKICYNESLDYLLTYGSYNSILEFLLRHDEFDKCLGFALENRLEPDLFLNAVYLPCLRNGNVEKLHEEMSRRDSSLFVWKKYLLHVCQYLERRQYLNILYQLQLFMKDSIRAAMTCIRFYLNDASSYKDLCGKTNFLLDAQTHLESELQMETLNRRRKRSTTSVHCSQGILTMEMEPSEIDKHLNTICRQMEIAKFLGNCEEEGRSPVQFLDLLPGKDSDGSQTLQVPTLFGNQQQKIDLAVLAILCGCNIEEGFGIAFRIMQDYNLPQQKVYSLAGHILTVKNQISAIQQLIKCCHTSGIPNSHVIADYVLSHCVKLLITRLRNEPEAVLKTHTSDLVRLITDTELKVNAYIECKQLKSAYLLAVKHSRAQDVRRILKESERLGQNAIKAICMKWLQQEPKL